MTRVCASSEGAKATELTGEGRCRARMASGSPVRVLQTRAVPSIDADTSHRLHGEMTISVISAEWPRSVCCSMPVRAHQTLMLASSEPVKIRRPVRSNAQQYTGARWPHSEQSARKPARKGATAASGPSPPSPPLRLLSAFASATATAVASFAPAAALLLWASAAAAARTDASVGVVYSRRGERMRLEIRWPTSRAAAKANGPPTGRRRPLTSLLIGRARRCSMLHCAQCSLLSARLPVRSRLLGAMTNLDVAGSRSRETSNRRRSICCKCSDRGASPTRTKACSYVIVLRLPFQSAPKPNRPARSASCFKASNAVARRGSPSSVRSIKTISSASISHAAPSSGGIGLLTQRQLVSGVSQ